MISSPLRRWAWPACVALLIVLAHPSPVVAAADSRSELEPYLELIAARLPVRARNALQKIEGTSRRLLAARAYVRAADGLESRWSWSAEQIESYTGSPEYRELIAEIGRVRARFQAQNPDYDLHANTQVRSFDLQLQRWNSNRSVAAVAQALRQDALEELRASSYRLGPDAARADHFMKFLQSWRPPTAAPLAAPGLSLHGQLRAIDFQIMKGGAIVAGTEVAAVRRVWEKQGWSKKLHAATAGSRFRGPLQSPNEPWHYEYTP